MQKVSFNEVYADVYIQQSIKAVISQTIKKDEILALYEKDMEQELWISISHALENFSREGKAGVQSFCRRVIDNRIKNLRRTLLIHNSRDGKALEADDTLRVFDKYNTTSVMMKMDIEAVISRLSPEFRKVCLWLKEGHNLKSTAKLLGLSDATFFYQYIRPLRRIFSEANLDKYLELN